MASSSASQNTLMREPTWTTDENDEDVRRMVISPGMIDQKADVHRDALGHSYHQLPDYYGLCYVTTYSNIYEACKARPRDRKTGEKCFFGDPCFTIYKWFERLEAATGISRNNGAYECESRDGLPKIMMVIASSDDVETLPRPAARIQAFKEFLRTKKEPMVKQVRQPRKLLIDYQLFLLDCGHNRADRARRASTWTCDENDEDGRRMVISPGLVGQKADVRCDSLGHQYAQLPDYHALCYAISYTNIVKMCKARPVDRNGQKCDYGDECFTIFKWFERLEAATGITRGRGLHECELKNGQPMIMMLVACSDKVDTLPRPAARIRAFQDFLGTKKEPMVKRFVQPRLYSD